MIDSEHIALKSLLQSADFNSLDLPGKVTKLVGGCGIKISRGDISRQKAIELLAPVVAGLLQSTANPDAAIAGNAKFWLGAYDRLIAPIEIVHTGADFVKSLFDALLQQGFMTQQQHDDMLTAELTYWQHALNDSQAINPTEADVINAENGDFE